MAATAQAVYQPEAEHGLLARLPQKVRNAALELMEETEAGFRGQRL